MLKIKRPTKMEKYLTPSVITFEGELHFTSTIMENNMWLCHSTTFRTAIQLHLILPLNIYQ